MLEMTMKEFKKLLPMDERKEVLAKGRFCLSKQGHAKQVAKAKVGDKVFFFDSESKDVGGDVPEVNFIISMATLVV